MEHHLGLTCAPICGLVQIPCIERNAVAAMRAINALSLANFLTTTRKISFDMVVETMRQTGLDINNKWTGGINTAFTFKDFTLSATLDVRYGGTMFSRTKNIMEFCGNGTVTTYNHRRPFIIPNSVVDNGDGTYSENTTPIYLADSSYQTYFDDYGAGEGRLYYLLDRSFAKLRNVSLTWNVPNKWAKAMHLSGLSASAFCNNVFTWTPAENVYVDPEATNEGTDLSAMFGETYVNPSCRIWGFNLNIKF